MSSEDVQNEKEGKYQPLLPSHFPAGCGRRENSRFTSLLNKAYASPPSPQMPHSEGIPLMGLKKKKILPDMT